MTVGSVIDDALACVAAEHPVAYDEMRRVLAGRRLDLVVDGEAVVVVLDPSIGPTIHARTTTNDLCAILLGELGVVAAVLTDRLELVASPDDLVATSEALTFFMQGALRCVALAPIVERLFALRKGGT